MGLESSVFGRRATGLSLAIPSWGAWYCDAKLDGEHSLSGTGEIVFADLTLRGTVLSGGPEHGKSFFRIVGGNGGWGKTIPAKGYANDAGVRLLNVMSDAAGACGEDLDESTVDGSARIGPSFARPAGPACRILQALAPESWYVGEDGKTRLGARPARELATAATRTKRQPDRGTITLAPTRVANILPGTTIDGVQAVDVLHEVSAKGIRSTIWGSASTGTSRRLAAFRALLEQLDPRRAYRSLIEYRVISQEGKRLDLQPVLSSLGMPTLQAVRMRTGVAGATAEVTPGSRVLVAFVNADPGRPEVVAYEEADGDGFAPLFVYLGDGTLPAIRAGDLAGGIWPCAPTQAKVLI